MQNNTHGDEQILLSVQGCLFIVRKEVIVSTDWILAKMLSSDVPWTKTSDGQWYIDVDPNSFRLILAILSGLVDITGKDGDKLSSADLLLLKATSRYLMLDSIAQAVETIESGHTKAVSELQEEINSLKAKAEKLEKIQSAFEGLPTTVYECRAYKSHRAYNRCGCKTVIFGQLTLPDASCGDCDNDTSRLYHGQQFQSIYENSHCDDLQDFCDLLS